jgi:hypothetical protein
VALLDTRGLLGRLWDHFPRENVAPVLDVAGRHLVLACVIVIAGFSIGRTLSARSLVKVQREA